MLSRLSAMIRRQTKGWMVLLMLALFVFTVSVIFPLLSGLVDVPEQRVESIDTKLY